MEVGSVWGHGSYVAPDWTADWLHREAIFILDRWAQASAGRDYAELDDGAAGRSCRAGWQRLLRTNTYDPATRTRHRRPGPGARPSRPTSRTTPTCSRNGSDRVRHPGGRADRPRHAARSWRRSSSGPPGPRRRTGPTTTSPTRTTGRTSRWSATGPPATRSSGPASASSCCWRASARWSGGTPSQTRRRRDRRRARQTIRCSAAIATPSQRATRQVLLGRRRR